jgi:hypothetical protein
MNKNRPREQYLHLGVEQRHHTKRTRTKPPLLQEVGETPSQTCLQHWRFISLKNTMSNGKKLKTCTKLRTKKSCLVISKQGISKFLLLARTSSA